MTHGCMAGFEGTVGEVMVTIPKTVDPEASIDEVRAVFDDDHVHLVLVVASDGRLLTTIEREDLAGDLMGSGVLEEIGTLAGRTAPPGWPLERATAVLKAQGRRRLAVIDEDGRLLGLLCLKRHGNGYCSDDGVRARGAERQESLVLSAAALESV